MQKLTFETPATVTKALGYQSVMTFGVFETPAEIADWALANAKGNYYWIEGKPSSWAGGETSETACRKTHTGDMQVAEQSEKYLAKFDTFDLSTARALWSSDIVGHRPDVPAFIAGHPISMKRRVKQDDANAPIAILVDLSISAAIDAEDAIKRGAVIFALTRMLAARRPVELWVTSSGGANKDEMGCVLARVNTTPMDLATAGYVLGHTAFVRAVCFPVGTAQYNFNGAWAFNNYAFYAKHIKELYSPLFPHVTDMLFIPGLHSRDASVTDSEAWLADKLRTYAPGMMPE